MSQEVFQSLSDQQQEDYGRAEALAWAANEAFDARIDFARALADSITSDGIDDNSQQKVYKNGIEHETEHFNLYKFAAEISMPSRQSFDYKGKLEDDAVLKPIDNFEAWALMTDEQRAKAAELKTAIAAGSLKEHGVTEDTLRVIATEVDGHKKFTLTHTGPGIDIGNHRKDFDKKRSYNSVMSDKNDALFQVEINGVTYDTRSGMTDDVYTAKVEEARSRGVTLPDSQQLSQETGDDWTWTMLTGEPLTAGGNVRIRGVGGGQVRRGFSGPGSGDRGLRVCPAVEIK